MRPVLNIALNTFRECLRDKLIHTSGIFALILIAFSIFLGDWALFYREQMIKSFSLSIMTFAGLFLAVFMGVGVIQREIQKKTVLLILSHPFPRWHFILGKFIGLQWVLLVNYALMACFLYLILFLKNANPTFSLLPCIFSIYLEMALITAAAILFSSFSTPYLSGWFTLGFYAVGHLAGEFLEQVQQLSQGGVTVSGGTALPEWMISIAKILHYTIPNLEKLNFKSRVIAGYPVSFAELFQSSLYALCFIGILLILSSVWFGYRDFE